MKNKNYLLIVSVALLLTAMFTACDKPEESEIVYQSVNKNYILSTDYDAMNSTDSVSAQHVDSILNGLLDAELVSTGFIRFDLDGDQASDIAFEIIDLQPFNNNNLPESYDSLAVSAHPISVGVLDNSTYKYADALDADAIVNSAGNWTNEYVVLGTFMHSGQFNGHGEKYLAVRLNGENDFKYGWIKIYISEHNDTLKVIEYAYNKIEGSQIRAGQKE